MACDNGQQFQVWSRQCVSQSGNIFYGWPYYLVELRSNYAWYGNRFGEIQGGFGAQKEEAYVPLCNS
jgi:hypothetical protein